MKKITYASLADLGEDFHLSFETALERVAKPSRDIYPLTIGGKKIVRRQTFADRSPADTRRPLGKFSLGTDSDVKAALAAAKRAFGEWSTLKWEQRVQFLRRAAEIMQERQFELAAILTLEVGKNRFEAIAEVSESIDLIEYYANQIEAHNGYEVPLVTKGKERTRSILKPYGVWAVISPFNFPLALATGMATGALLGGNAVVFKPATDTPWSGVILSQIFHEAGLPPGVFNCVTGFGAAIGNGLINDPAIDGLIFTGSRRVGFELLKCFPHKYFPRPCIVELGGKNPAIVMPSADLDDATEGVLRSAFGMGGEKCSACSRVYLHTEIYKQFVKLLVEQTRNIVVGNPAERETFLGPLINPAAVNKYKQGVMLAKREGCIVYGGNVLKKGAFTHGYYVEPMIADRLSTNSRLFREEFFAPILAVARVRSLREAINLANNVDYGLTAGIFTNDDAEKRQFFSTIESGVTYCNRRGGATTGAWPGIQSFGGWKASGSSGKSALGPYYVAQFMREQSQTTVTK